jgi:SAM-dependent methyltransferase
VDLTLNIANLLRRSDGQAKASKRRLREHLAAWWNGTALPPLEADANDGKGDEAAKIATQPAKSAAAVPAIWPRERIEVAQILWGPEFLSPLDRTQILEFARPLAIAKGRAVLDAGAALGGATRAISQEHSTYVYGLEPSAELAGVGMDLTLHHEMKTMAPVAAYDAKKTPLKPAGFDRALVHELLFTFADKDELLRQIARALKPEGQILIADYFIEDRTRNAAIAAWQSADPAPVKPWSLAEARQSLAKLKIELRSANDETTHYRGLIVRGMDRFLKGAAQQAINRNLTAALKREIELWGKRLAAFDSGALRFFCLHGYRAGDPDK